MFANVTPKRFLALCLFGELITIGLVALCFILIHPQVYAGLGAGSLFLILGGFICHRVLTHKEFARSAVFWIGGLHLIISLVMILTRVVHFTEDFNSLSVLGIPGPLYHNLATYIYVLLIAATLFDLYRCKLPQKTASK